LVQRWFGADFNLGRLRHVLGLLAAGVAGSAAGAICWIVASRLFYGLTGPIPITFAHWFMSDMVGFIALGPFVIGLFAAVRQPPPWREIIEGIVALLALAAVIAMIIPLSPRLWATMLPIAWLFPMLLWLTARCRPVFAAAAAGIVSVSVVSTTVFGIGHFGDPSLPIDDRILLAQSAILFVALSTFVLAALFAERRESEARLALSKMMLEREQDNKLLNVQAAVASIAHEIRQPLTAVVAQTGAALRFFERTPPSYDQVRDSLNKIRSAGLRTSEVFDGLRSLFGKLDQEQRPIDMNQIVRDVLDSLHAQLNDRGIDTRAELTAELPLVNGNRGQLQEVVFNLVNNAIEAMDLSPKQNRMLRMRTECPDDKAIVVSIEDTGPGIDSQHNDSIFAAGITTKAQGTGLGLAISRMIVEHHGGRLTATSDGKSGARFQIVLPIEPAAAGAAAGAR
jgi:signal transduction histidine kinase